MNNEINIGDMFEYGTKYQQGYPNFIKVVKKTAKFYHCELIKPSKINIKRDEKQMTEYWQTSGINPDNEIEAKLLKISSLTSYPKYDGVSSINHERSLMN